MEHDSPLQHHSQLTDGGHGHVSRHGDATVAFLAGEIDVSTASHTDEVLRATLADAAERQVSRVELDLSAVTFIDSTGMSALVTARRITIAAGRSFVVREASEPVRRLLKLTKLNQVFGLGN
jgi:anti-sigma B factor antagonist